MTDFYLIPIGIAYRKSNLDWGKNFFPQRNFTGLDRRKIWQASLKKASEMCYIAGENLCENTFYDFFNSLSIDMFCFRTKLISFREAEKS